MRSAFAIMTVLATLWSAPSPAADLGLTLDVSRVHAPDISYPYDHLRFAVDVCGTFNGPAPAPTVTGKIVREGSLRPVLITDQIRLYIPRDPAGHDFCTTLTDLAPSLEGGPGFFIVHYRVQFGKIFFPFAMLLKVTAYMSHPMGLDVSAVDQQKLSLAMSQGIVITDPRAAAAIDQH